MNSSARQLIAYPVSHTPDKLVSVSQIMYEGRFGFWYGNGRDDRQQLVWTGTTGLVARYCGLATLNTTLV
jgi:hypothetical protein